MHYIYMQYICKLFKKTHAPARVVYMMWAPFTSSWKLLDYDVLLASVLACVSACVYVWIGGEVVVFGWYAMKGRRVWMSFLIQKLTASHWQVSEGRMRPHFRETKQPDVLQSLYSNTLQLDDKSQLFSPTSRKMKAIIIMCR